jgi:hypothetical protein
MPEIAVSEEMYARATAFKDVIEAITDEEISFDDCVEVILSQGIDSMLADLLGSQDLDTLLKSFQQLGSKYPSQVYHYVAEIWREGGIALDRERIRHKLGFRTSADVDNQT